MRSRSRGLAPAGSRPPRPWSRTWSRSSARPAPASSRTTRAGERSSVCPKARCPRRSTCGSRSPTARACSRSSRSSLAAHGISVARLVQQQGEEQRHVARRHPRDPGRAAGRGAGRDRPPRRDARRRLGAPGRSPTAASRSSGGRDAHPGRGRDAAPSRAAALGAARLRALAEVGGREPDRELQGPRHGGRGRPRGRAPRAGGHLRLDGQHRGVGRRLRRTRGPAGAHPRSRPARWRAGSSSRCVAAGAELREVDGSFEDAHALARRLAADEGLGQRQLDQPGPDRRAGLGGTRGRRAAGRGTRRTRASVRGRGQHERLRPRLRRGGRGQPAAPLGAVRRACDDRRLRDPDRLSGPPRAGRGRCGGRHRARRRAARVVVGDRAAGRAVLRAGVGGGGRRGRAGPARRAASSACSPATG